MVAKGYGQKEGIDYHETFAPVVKYKSLRVILALANEMDYEIKQLDVVTAFLNAYIKEDVYMQQPQGFEQGGDNNNLVCKLNKTLYGIKQAPHEWNNEINDFLVHTLCFKRCITDTCLYVKQSKRGRVMIIALFVDDIIPTFHTQDGAEWNSYKVQLMSKFKIQDKSDCEWILGMKVTRDRKRKVLALDQGLYIEKVLTRFNMMNCNPAPTPETAGVKLSIKDCPETIEEKKSMENIPYKAAVGSLLYASIATRPDIAHAVNEVSKYMQNPGPTHWQAIKRIFRYLRGTIKKPLIFKGNWYKPNSSRATVPEYSIEAYSDADWAGDVDSRRSTTGYVVQINNSTVSWLSKKQATVALSSAEAEYMAIATVAQEIKWLSQLMEELSSIANFISKKNITVYSDNQAAIAISKNDVHHDRTKHIDIRHHFIRDCVKEGVFNIQWISTKEQIADTLTKGLDKLQFTTLIRKVMGPESSSLS